jgi:hypothetical protein
MRRHHDVGGELGGPIERGEHDLEPWEKKVDAVVRLLLAKRLMSLDEMRRAIEDLGPGAYDRMSYFERWISATTNVLLAKGVVGVQELGAAIEAAGWRDPAGRPS